jgi:hypothetical protein
MYNDEDLMPKRLSSDLKAQAYQDLLALYWKQAPGGTGTLYEESRARLEDYLRDSEKVANASVAMGFMAYDEMLVGGNLIARNQSTEGWAWMDKAQTRAYSGLLVTSHSVWMPSAYTRAIFDFHGFCAFFSLALARGTEQQVLWYAQQIYNLRRGGLADESCEATEYLDFYWEMAIAVLINAWPSEADLSPDIGAYRDLFLCVADENKVQDALLRCAQYHLQIATTAPKNEKEGDHPFRGMYVGALAYELMGWIGLYKRLHGPLELKVAHPMLLPALLNAPAQQPYSDSFIEQLRANATVKYGPGWAPERVANFDKLWP